MSEQKISSRQWKAFAAAWLGWAFDGLDGYLYVLVASIFVRQLLGGASADPADVQTKGALIQGVFLIGWACGGIIFGRIGDKLGRARTLSLTILTYAMFTGLTFFAQTWWHLLILRFLAALGIGGEWAAGSALVSETWHSKHRAWASATLQSGYMCGMILAALTTGWMSSFEPRYVFLVGVLPALATFWIRRSIDEPDEWRGEVTKREPPPISALFSKSVLPTTLLTLALTSIALTTVWAFLYFGTQQLTALGKAEGMSDSIVRSTVVGITIVFTLWNIVGNYFATYLAKLAGFRFAFAILMAASLVIFYIGFREPRPLSEMTLWMSLAAFVSLGLFGIFPLYIPPLFPTLLRTTGAGFSYNFGRIISGIALIALGVSQVKVALHLAVFYVGFLFIPGIIISFLMPELRDDEEITPSAPLAAAE